MASVNDYLKKLLYQYDCVVVPELGAFLTHYQSAAFTEVSGLYLPPRKRVAFNEALRFDDGILANYIMLHEPVTREGAQRHISLFVSELQQQVDTAGRFELDGIGTFSRNDEGRLQFDPSLRHNFFGEAYGMSALSAQLINRQPQSEPVLEAIPVTALGPVLVRDEDTTLTPLHPDRSYWRVAAVALLVGSLGVVSYFSVIKPGQPLQSSLDPANLFRVPAYMTAPSAAPKGPSEAITMPKATPAPTATESTSSVAPSITPATTAPIAESIETKEEPVAVAASSDVNTNPAPAAKPASVESIASPSAKPVRTGPYFTVIAGVFSSKVRAMPLIRHLHKAGYPDAYVIMPTLRRGKGQLFKVAATSSQDRAEAQSYLPEISKMIGSNAWIYTH